MRRSAPMLETTPDDVLKFWLGDEPTPTAETRQRWWKKDKAFDDEIRARFGSAHARACAGELDDWQREPRGTVALVILLDQFSRNIHRDDPRAWAHDAKAQQVVMAALERGIDAELSEFERVFLYMPLMHAEDLALQNECVQRMQALADNAAREHRALLDSNVDFAERHRDIVERFGRFPHRNQLLGRPSTDEERAFLQQPGSSF